MAFDHDGNVGDFRRSGLRKVFEAYRRVLQDGLDEPTSDDLTKAFLTKRLVRFEELTTQWTKSWFQLGVEMAPTASEQDEREAALPRIEAQLEKDCPHIFNLSFYVPVWKNIPDNIKKI